MHKNDLILFYGYKFQLILFSCFLLPEEIRNNIFNLRKKNIDLPIIQCPNLVKMKNKHGRIERNPEGNNCLYLEENLFRNAECKYVSYIQYFVVLFRSLLVNMYSSFSPIISFTILFPLCTLVRIKLDTTESRIKEWHDFIRQV